MSFTMLDLNSAARGQASAFSPLPPSPLPRIWIGFILAIGMLAIGVMTVTQSDKTGGPLMVLATLVNWAYWLFCVHRFHRILGEISPHAGGETTYPITPGQAVGYHFIPVYGLFWFFKWPSELAEFLKNHTSVRTISGVALGSIVLLSMAVAQLYDGFIGFTLLFATGLYISSRLRQAIAERETLRETASAFA